jgi:hypothetical protein
VGFYYLYVILAYLLVMTGYNIYRSRQVKSQDDFMVAGRSLSLTKMVFTLVCTWIGSGTFIAGAEYASYAGWSAIWQPAGAFLGIAIIYFIAARIRTFGQYTVGDILEARYGRFARLFGAIALIVAFTTIVAYQFRAGGYILNVVTDGYISLEVGQTITACFVILFVTIGGMVAVAHTDLPNGIIIVSACLLAVPFVISSAGGWAHAHEVLGATKFQVFAQDFGKYPALKGFAYFLSTLLLLMGVQSMYQKFYAAKSPAEAKKAVAIWIVGTIVVETIVIAIAVYASVYSTERALGWDGRALVLNAARYMVAGRRVRGGAVHRHELPAVVELERDARHLPGDDQPERRPDEDGGAAEGVHRGDGLLRVPDDLRANVHEVADLDPAVRLLRLHDVRGLGDTGVVRGADVAARDLAGRAGVDRGRCAGDGVLRVRPAVARAGHPRRGGWRERLLREGPVGDPQHLPGRVDLNRPARGGQPADAEAEAGDAGAVVWEGVGAVGCSRQ